MKYICNIKKHLSNRITKYFLPFLCSALILIPLSFLPACGKKGDPTLKSYEKPDPPSLLKAVHREDRIYLRWSYPKSKEDAIADFIILKSSGSGFEKISHVEKTGRSYIDPDFKEGLKYNYKIISQNFRGVYSKDSNIIEITPLKPPLPPGNISFKAEHDALILTWESAGKDILYNIYRSSEKGAYGLNPANKEPLSANSFKDYFEIDKTVYYTIRSLTKNEIRDEGPSSAEVTVNPFEFIPSPPKNLQYLADAERVYLIWKEPEETWITTYRVYRRIENQDYALLGETKTPTFVDKEAPSRIRDYRVSAVGPKKEGPASEIKGIIFIPEK